MAHFVVVQFAREMQSCCGRRRRAATLRRTFEVGCSRDGSHVTHDTISLCPPHDASTRRAPLQLFWPIRQCLFPSVMHLQLTLECVIDTLEELPHCTTRKERFDSPFPSQRGEEGANRPTFHRIGIAPACCRFLTHDTRTPMMIYLLSTG